MKLADQVAQCRTPFVVQTSGTGDLIRLDNAAECASAVAAAPIRFVLSDDLTRLCTALAYSKGARTLESADLVRGSASLGSVRTRTVTWTVGDSLRGS